jgi:hypothetical protein
MLNVEIYWETSLLPDMTVYYTHRLAHLDHRIFFIQIRDAQMLSRALSNQ